MAATATLEDFDIDLDIELEIAPEDSTRITAQFTELCSVAVSDWVCGRC
jgi:hypothetical protein